MCCMIRVFWCYVTLVTMLCHVGFIRVPHLMKQQGQYESKVRVSFGVDKCWILYRYLIILIPNLEPKWMKFWSVGVSTVNLKSEEDKCLAWLLLWDVSCQRRLLFRCHIVWLLCVICINWHSWTMVDWIQVWTTCILWAHSHYTIRTAWEPTHATI